MNWVIAILAFFALTILALFIQKKIIEERRPRFKIVIHLLNGNPVVWYTTLSWIEVQKHLPPCMSKMGDDRVTCWQIEPP